MKILSVGQPSPLVLAVENLHWIDPTSEEWLVLLVESLAAIPLLLLTTYRPGYRPPWMDKSYATQVALTRLSPADSFAVVQSVSHTTALDEPYVEEILTKGAGNPFFLEELTRALSERDDASLTLSVPATVQSVLAARMDSLPPAAKRILQMASVIGTNIPVALLQAITEVPGVVLDHELQHLQRAEFLYALPSRHETVYTFQHVLTQEVAYQSLLPQTRQQVHERVARVLAEHFPTTVETRPERLAHHYTEAGLHAQAVAYWQRAGQQAVERAAYVEAASHFRTGLDALRTLPDTPERTRQELYGQISLGNALIATTGWGTPDVEQVFLHVYDLCHQVEESSELFLVLNRLCNLYAVRGSVQRAREYGEELLKLAQRLDDPGWLGISHASLGEVLWLLGAFTQAREHLEQARSLLLARSNPTDLSDFDRLHGIIRSHTMMMRVLWYLGYPDQALRTIQEALSFAHELGSPFVLAIICNFASVLYMLRGEVQRAQQEAERVLALATEHGLPQWTAAGTFQRGWALAAAVKDQTEESIALMRQGLIAGRETGSEVAHARRLGWFGEMLGKVGRVAEGLQVLDEAQTVADETGERAHEAELHRLKGELLLQLSSDNRTEAQAYFQQALDIARSQQAKSLELCAATSLARLWQSQDKHEEAHDLLAPVYNWFTEGFDTADVQDAKALLDELG